MKISVDKMLDKGVRTLLTFAPFYGLFLMRMKREITEEVPLTGISLEGINIYLKINPKFFQELPEDQKMYGDILVHEIRHICHGHLNMVSNYPNKDLFNIAADIYINQDLKALPEGYVYPSDFGLPDGKSTKWYYKEMEKQINNGEQSQGLEDMMQALSDNKNVTPNHNWEDFEELDDTLKEAIQHQLDHHAKDIADGMRMAGQNPPGELSDWLDGLNKVWKPNLSWKDFVRKFFQGNIETFKKYTKKRRNKRFEDAKGRKMKTIPLAIVYLDGSGSVSNEEYEMVYSELQHMKGAVAFDIAHFDLHVSEPYRYNGENKLPKSNGGTNFTHVREHFNKNSDEYSFAVILTDGYAEDPGVFSKPVLWLITTTDGMDYCKNFHGMKIRMKKEM